MEARFRPAEQSFLDLAFVAAGGPGARRAAWALLSGSSNVKALGAVFIGTSGGGTFASGGNRFLGRSWCTQWSQGVMGLRGHENPETVSCNSCLAESGCVSEA